MIKGIALFLILFFALSKNIYSQIYFGEEHIIVESTSGFVHVHSGDLDGDGDMDIVIAKYSILMWVENLGDGSFSTPDTIINEQRSMQSVFLSDLDEDNDLDIITESNSTNPNDQVVWFQNDGEGNFSSKMIISSSIESGHCVFATDIDGDGDNDVLSASVYDDKIAWYRNEGGGIFSSQIIISSTTNGASTVYASDIDGDGDNDVIAGGA